jgi:hypothetical protein
MKKIIKLKIITLPTVLLLITALLQCCVMVKTHAAFNRTTCHSRANCGGINESITWNALQSFDWKVISYHSYKKELQHVINTGFTHTWRQAVVHWTEAYANPNWFVEGLHFYIGYNGREVYDMNTQAQDCSIYDGWWDKP